MLKTKFEHFYTITKMLSTQEQSRERVYSFFLKNRARGKKYIVDHFSAEDLHMRESKEVVGSLKNDSKQDKVPQIHV